MSSNSPRPRLLTFLPTLRQLVMDTTWLPLLVSHIGSPHPFGLCSRLVSDGYVSGSPSRTLPGVHNKQKPKLSACAVTRRLRGEYAVRPCCFPCLLYTSPSPRD